MNAERWERLNIVFHAATALDPEQRAAYLDDTCRDDAELRRDAERLITAHERARNFIDTPPSSSTAPGPTTARTLSLPDSASDGTA